MFCFVITFIIGRQPTFGCFSFRIMIATYFLLGAAATRVSAENDVDSESLFTTVHCSSFTEVPDQKPFHRQVNDQTCRFKNLYREKGRWVMVFPLGSENHVTKGSYTDSGDFVSGYVPSGVTAASKFDYPLNFHHSFKSEDDIRDQLALSESRLTFFLGQLFPHNAGHFLWDNLYAAYDALSEFGLQDEVVNLVFPDVHSGYFPEKPQAEWSGHDAWHKAAFDYFFQYDVNNPQSFEPQDDDLVAIKDYEAKMGAESGTLIRRRHRHHHHQR